MGKRDTLFGEDPDEGFDVELKVNQNFAQKFEHNKKREELQRLKEKYPEQAARIEAKELARQARIAKGGPGAEDDEDESSTDEDEDDGYIPDKVELQIFKTLAKIRAKDKSVYEPDAKFYSSDDDDDDGDDKPLPSSKEDKKKKPMYLKDIVYQQALKDAEGDSSSSDDEHATTTSDESDGEKQRNSSKKKDSADDSRGGVKAYDSEQKELKSAFLTAFDDDAGDGEDDGFGGGVLKPKKKSKSSINKKKKRSSDDESSSSSSDEDNEGEDDKIRSVVDAYFTADKDSLPDDEKFLRDYIIKKAWIDTENGDYQGTGHSDDDDEEQQGNRGFGKLDEDLDEYDEEYLKAADQFEAQYNFRYEEPGSSQLITYPRQISGTVRKEDDRRKKKRAEKAARLAEEEEKRAADVKRLKNLKKKEIEDRLKEVRQVAGAAAPTEDLLGALVDGDFDPDAHDKAMAAAFGDEYYDAIGVDDDIADAEFERELAAMAEYSDADEEDEGKEGTFAALKKRLARGQNDEDEEEEDEEEENNILENDEALVQRVRADLKRLMEEYHKLDYEDHVGGIPTRFRYKEVPKADYGLTPADILALDDKELNQVVGLKRVAAPYREDEGLVRPNYGKLNEFRREKGLGGGPGSYHQQRDWRQGGVQKNNNKGGGSYHQNGHKQQQRQQQQRKQYIGGVGSREPALVIEREHEEHEEQQEGPRAITPDVSHGLQQSAAVSQKERRLATYAKPTLKRPDRPSTGGGYGGDDQQQQPSRKKHKKTNHGGGDERKQSHNKQQVVNEPSGLTKAQKKNLARSKKRAAKKGQQ